MDRDRQWWEDHDRQHENFLDDLKWHGIRREERESGELGRVGADVVTGPTSIPEGAEGLRQYILNFISTSNDIDPLSKDLWCGRLASMDLRSDCTAEIGGLLKDVEGFHEDVMRGASLPWDPLEEATDRFLKDLEQSIIWLDARHFNEIT